MIRERSLDRYKRQITIAGIGKEGQERLMRAHVLLAGAGGLGSVVAIYLAVAGVGRIRLIDHDKVEISNLNRQTLHWERDIGKAKVDSAKDKLKGLNSEAVVETIAERITEDNAFELADDCELIVDAMDNFATRYVLNKVAISRRIPLFHGAVRGFEGRVTTIIPGLTPCLKCLYHRAPQPEETPIIGVAPAVIGSIQATEVIKYICALGKLLTNRLLIYDGLSMEFTEIGLKRRLNCEECGHVIEDRKHRIAK